MSCCSFCDGITWSFRAVAENGLLTGVAVSKKLRKVVGIIGASADVWIVFVDVGLDGSFVTELISGIVNSSKNVPGVLETWGEHASKRVDCHNLESWETGSHGHDSEFNHELSIWWDFSEESLPSCISHSDSSADARWDDFLTTVEWKVACHNLFFLIFNYKYFCYLPKKYKKASIKILFLP